MLEHSLVDNELSYLHYIFTYNPELFTCLGFLIGILLGSWLAIGRDKRKEFNEISRPLFEELNRNVEYREFGQHANTGDWRLIESYIFFKRGFRKAIRNYKEAQKNISSYEPSTGIVTFNEERINNHIVCARKLLSYLKRR